MTCPWLENGSVCRLANAVVSPKICTRCQSSWQDGHPPTADTLPPILVSITGGIAPKPEPPPLTTQLLTAGKAFLAFVRSGGQRLPKADRDARLRTCKACHKYEQGRCRSCGCFVSVKTWLPEEHCPLGQWAGDPPQTPKKGCGHCGK